MVWCFDKRAGFFTGGVDLGKKRMTATPLSVNSAKEEPFFGVDRSKRGRIFGCIACGYPLAPGRVDGGYPARRSGQQKEKRKENV